MYVDINIEKLDRRFCQLRDGPEHDPCFNSLCHWVVVNNQRMLKV